MKDAFHQILLAEASAQDFIQTLSRCLPRTREAETPWTMQEGRPRRDGFTSVQERIRAAMTATGKRKALQALLQKWDTDKNGSVDADE